MWPPDVADLRLDMGLAHGEGDTVQLQLTLDAAIVFVERVRADAFEGLDESVESSPGGADPLADLYLGTLRLARRWHERRKSPDGLLDMAEMGAGRIPSFDPDIERLLRIGKFRGPVFA